MVKGSGIQSNSLELRKREKRANDTIFSPYQRGQITDFFPPIHQLMNGEYNKKQNDESSQVESPQKNLTGKAFFYHPAYDQYSHKPSNVDFIQTTVLSTSQNDTNSTPFNLSNWKPNSYRVSHKKSKKVQKNNRTSDKQK